MSRKILQLRKTAAGRNDIDYLYEVVENGAIIASRRSSRDYVACFVFKEGDKFIAPNFFGHTRNMLTGEYGRKISNVYAIAILDGHQFEL